MSLLIFGYGNPSRGDDALGPALLERISELLATHPAKDDTTLLTDFQLQPEHTLDLADRDGVLFLDASVSCAAPYAFARLTPQAEVGYTTHAMHPAALLAVYRQVMASEPPPAWLLTVRGVAFELGEPISIGGQANLDAAFRFVAQFLNEHVVGQLSHA